MIENTRQLIDEIDKEMASLFVKRMKASKEIAEMKKKQVLPVEDNYREELLIAKNSNLVSDPELKKYYIDFLKSTISISKRYQTSLLKGIRVAYCGVEGAFAHIATMNLFPSGEYVSYPSFESAYRAVVNSECDTCVLPIENSFAGDVGNVMDLIFSGPLFVSQVYDLAVTQDLLAKKGTKKEEIKKVISHSQALNQCADYIEKHGFQSIEYENTATSAIAVRDSDDKTLACIASGLAAKLYDLEVIESGINSSRNNTTRFAVFSKTLVKRERVRKMAEHFILVFTVRNEAGSLAKALNIIGAHGFNMRNLTSRPMKELMWSYYFFLELEGNINSQDGEDMLNELRGVCDRLKLAGTYCSNYNI